MHAHLKKILESKTVWTRGGEALPLHSSIIAAEGTMLQEIIREIKPKISLEIGMAYGISTMFICEALMEVRAQKHIVIDNWQHDPEGWKGIGVLNLEKCGYSNLLELIEKPSEIILPRLLESQTRVDFAFIDGCHTFDHCLLDFFYVNRMLNVGGVVAFDDCNLLPVQKVIHYIRQYPAYKEYKRTAIPAPRTKRQKLRRIFKFWDIKYQPRCIAFQKVSEDKRHWDWYKSF